MNYIIFDDNKWINFFPITLTRPVFDLRSGILKLRQRIKSFFGFDTDNYVISNYLLDLYHQRHPDWILNKLKNERTLFINSRIRFDQQTVDMINNLELNNCLVNEEDILAALFQPDVSEISSENVLDLFKDLNRTRINIRSWQSNWELISENRSNIENDFADFFYDKENYFETELGITVINPYNIWIGEDTKIKPGVVIDASQGPVILDEGVNILPNAVIIGPVYIGKKSVIKAGARIYEGTSIGPLCKIGGEVEGTIFQGFTNKQHEGFLGHSFLGEWINIGAGTNNSDLKNNYENVKMYFYPSQTQITTPEIFLGTIIGDHTKTAVNTTINTGTVIGVGCNLFGREVFKDHIPSLSWGTGQELREHNQKKFLETAGLVKNRRDMAFSEEDKKFFRNIKNMEQLEI